MRTRATLRSAEFGFLGVVVKTRVQTPRRWGAVTFFLRPLPDFRPGVASFFVLALRPFRTSWLVVGMRRVMVAACLGPPHDGQEGPRRWPSSDLTWSWWARVPPERCARASWPRAACAWRS